MTNIPHFLSAFSAREDLVQYESNGLLLYVAEQYLDLEDVHTFATTALTDGSNDKKCDLVVVSEETRQVIIAQGYWSNAGKTSAPANKASDLNTAVSWVLAGDLDQIPVNLRGAAEEVREALDSGRIDQVHVWFVHNCPESQNVETELAQASLTAAGLISHHFPTASVDVSHSEYGVGEIESLYQRGQVPILVSDKIEFEIPGGYAFEGDAWSAFSTLVNASDLHTLWNKHKTDLLSPNIRSYLGSKKSAQNINNGIKESAISTSRDFSVFNNGITVLVNDYEVVKTRRKSTLKISGMGVVNGGQTTGSLGSIPISELHKIAETRVMARFIKCRDLKVLESIVRFNNTQNKVEATDFRSKDAVQQRLRAEMELVPDAEYRGGMRGGGTDQMTRSRFLLPDRTVSQTLAAFHGDANLAYNETRTIWDRDTVYSSVFRETVTARHIVFTYSLLRSIERMKQDLVAKTITGRTVMEQQQLDFLTQRGATFVVLQAIGYSVEEILGRPVADRYSLQFKKNLSPAEASEAWLPIARITLSQCALLRAATNQNLKSDEKTSAVMTQFGGFLDAIKTVNSQPFSDFAEKILP